MNKNKFDFESGGLTSEQTRKLRELMEVLEKANNDLKALVDTSNVDTSNVDTSNVDTSKVDTRELTPMGRVIEEFNIRTEDNFINWMSVYEKELLQDERELIINTFDFGFGDDSTGFHYFDSQFKQTP